MKRISITALLLGGVLFAAPGLMPSFDDFDTNGDGKITQTEFENTQQARMTKQAKSGKMMRNAANAPSFGDIDTDDNGAIDATELKNHQMAHMKERPGSGTGLGKSIKCGGSKGPNR